MTYSEAVEWLFSQTRAGAPRGLSRIRELMERLGHPEGAFPAVHVVGTNGKGSVVAYLEAAFKAAGGAFGATTSPHLVDFRERIRSHLGPIGEAEVCAFVRWARAQRFREPVAFFDLTTALAFQHFSSLGVRIAAVEAGVGGALDATNVLPRVEATVITNIGEDHLETLGGSLVGVAQDKAGAIRPGVPVVTGAEGVGLEVIRAVAAERGAPLYVLEEEDPLFALPAEPSLRGRFQRKNARLAAAALRLLGYSEEVVSAGIANAHHPGRMQLLRHQGVPVVLDGAHNPPAARALAEEFQRFHLVFGAFPRKDYPTILQILLPKALSLRYTCAGRGALQAQALQGLFSAPYFELPLAALEDAVRAAQAEEAPVLVTGSLYLVGEVLKQLQPASEDQPLIGSRAGAP
ncbi:MAG: Mur ligase family protein [Meiothermus sp.]|uniref:bifunctional folylpolyglutamate synthase/dihydrofolate synthase n=1 Tax=Meiothermus sp. TaxID=1955249 RepID=UPI0025E03E3C|nr:cyanophycin synthetase [Meiothermus sp.]MCS7058174.1 Mur ligase family protein [Meiothermus sp.]MCS7193311.1 Mur ligase family protein [Meiothermus sp.]MCX7741562.1 Mur ligase family protein [Meiothermus sp.]MDW8091204.1 cyanophycin synthetase [Meiothermus sp.]MDW8482009.1 cyanophycin synthetase [Meiothermus sp.]